LIFREDVTRLECSDVYAHGFQNTVRVRMIS